MNAKTLLLTLLSCLPALASGAADTRFLAFGDSITVGHGDGSVRCPNNTSVGGYPPRLRSELASRGLDAEVLNFGLCGERTFGGLTRIDSVLAQGGDVILIMEGTNDVSTQVGFETTLFNLNAMAIKAEVAGIEPVLASIIPRGPDSGADSNNGKGYTIAMRLREDAAEQGWAFADPFHALFDRPSFFALYYFDQLHPNPTGYAIVADEMLEPALEASTRNNLCAQVPDGPCVESGTVLCLNQGRFRLEAVWENFQGQPGVGQAVPQTDDTGAFYWVDPENIELVIKVLDGRGFNGHFWVFYGALSNVKFSLVVTDIETDECLEYFNPLGTFASVGDTAAFFAPDIDPPPNPE